VHPPSIRKICEGEGVALLSALLGKDEPIILLPWKGEKDDWFDFKSQGYQQC
jgi:hypothetical protein